MPEDTRDFLKELLDKHEGNRPDVYLDGNNNPTIGRGLNLNSPVVKTYFQGNGLDPAAIASGQTKPTPQDLEGAYNYVVGAKNKEFDNIQKNALGGVQLDPSKEAALKSLYFNSPALIGPNLRTAVAQGDDNAATKEILLGSNKDQSPGVLKRRLDEAKYYAQDKFPDVISSMSPDELGKMQGIMAQMPDSADKRQLLNENPFLKPTYQSQPMFNSIRQTMAGNTEN